MNSAIFILLSVCVAASLAASVPKMKIDLLYHYEAECPGSGHKICMKLCGYAKFEDGSCAAVYYKRTQEEPDNKNAEEHLSYVDCLCKDKSGWKPDVFRSRMSMSFLNA